MAPPNAEERLSIGEDDPARSTLRLVTHFGIEVEAHSAVPACLLDKHTDWVWHRVGCSRRTDNLSKTMEANAKEILNAFSYSQAENMIIFS